MMSLILEKNVKGYTTKQKIAVYCRVSSDDQKERETIENQIEILNTYIEMKEDIEKFKEYLDDGISGTISFENRPAGKKLIEDAKKGLFTSILVWKIDRFGRDTLSGLSAVELLRKYNVEIISITEPFDLNTPTGRFQFITYLNMAELERNNILDRMFLGATRAAKQGKWLGGIVPYVYYVDKNKFLKVNEIEAIVIRKIFDMYINDRLSGLDIAVYLNSTGIDCNYAARGTGKRNKEEKKSLWSISTIQRILSSATYIGIHEYGKRSTRRKETIIRNVPAIIPVEIYDIAKKLRKENLKISKRNSPNRTFILRTLIKCKHCNSTYYGIFYKDRNAVYSCSGKKSSNKKLYGIKCTNLNINSDEIETYIWDVCKFIMLDFDKYTIKNSSLDKLSESKIELNAIINKIKYLDTEKSNILKLYRKNLITEVELEEQLKDINNEKSIHLKFVDELKEKLSEYENKTQIINNMKNVIAYYKNKIDTLTDEEKMKVIRLFIKEIIIDNKIDCGSLVPNIHISWNMSDLIFERTTIKGTY